MPYSKHHISMPFAVILSDTCVQLGSIFHSLPLEVRLQFIFSKCSSPNSRVNTHSRREGIRGLFVQRETGLGKLMAGLRHG